MHDEGGKLELREMTSAEFEEIIRTDGELTHRLLALQRAVMDKLHMNNLF